MYSIGKNTYISPKAKVVGLHTAEPSSFIVGDNVYIGDDVQIICDDFRMGDYGKLHHHSNVHGNHIHIGHNAWIGQYTLIDGQGTVDIGDNFGVGFNGALYSHMKYGDTLEGCRFDSIAKLDIRKDVWLCGSHITMNPVVAHDKSMALAGSVITRDMEANHMYAGVPAKDITDKFGPQFVSVSVSQKMDRMNKFLLEFGSPQGIVIVENTSQFKDDGNTYFAVDTREYTKRLTDSEIAFMKFLLPSKGKFTPYDSV